jgi:CHAT domain-containing protein
MKKFLPAHLIAVFIALFLPFAIFLPAVGLAAGKSQFEVNYNSVREAIARGEVVEVLAFLEAQAADAERRNDLGKAADAYSMASEAARTAGQLQKAVNYAEKAIGIAERGKMPGRQATAMLYLVYANRAVGQYAKAREWMDKGLEVVKKMDHSLAREGIEANYYRMLGLDFMRLREYQKAVEYIAYSIQVQESRLSAYKRFPATNAEAIRSAYNLEISTLAGLGTAYQRLGNVEEAIKAYEKGIVLLKETGLKTQQEVSLYYGLGDLYLRQKNYPRALENLTRTLEMSEKLRNEPFIYLASSRLGDIHLQTQKPAEAIPYYKKAIDSVESTRSLLESEESRSAFFEDKRGIYAGLVVAYLRTKNTVEAFNYAERARSRAFLDILGNKVQLAKSGTLLEHERALQARISVLQAMMGGRDADTSQTPQLIKQLAEAQQAYNEFLQSVKKENKEQASLMSVEPLTLPQTQEMLDPGVTMLEYFVTQQAVLLWVVEKDRMRFVNIPISRTDLVQKVSVLRDSVFQLGEKERLRNSSEELYKLLIQPALQHVRGKELLVIPHDVLHYLPFQALVSSEGKYLIQDYPIYYLSSASLMQFTHEKRRAGGERALVMGNPSLGDEAYNLRFAEREAKEVAIVYPQSQVYLKEEASKPNAISQSPKYDMLHFAVHAELNEDDPMGSALLLAVAGKEDGRLKVGEVFALDLKVGLVVLSACETGLGKLSNGDELIGLTRAFIYAGTPSIITTLWKVNDRSSYELMREFYQHLKSSKKVEALRQAQLTTMKEFPEPFYWAAYELTGEP